MKNTAIFRKVALERLSSPDQLDQLITITSPKSWLALLGFFSLITFTIVWSIFGKVPTKIEAEGILTKVGGTASVISAHGGEIVNFYVQVGDIVDMGDIIARIDQIELTEKLSAARRALEEYKKQNIQTETMKTRSLALQGFSNKQQSDILNNKISFNVNKLSILKAQLTERKSLHKDGLITQKDVLQTEESIEQVEREIEGYKNQLKQLELKKLSQVIADKEKSFSYEKDIQTMTQTVEELELQFELSSKIISSFSGRVVEVEVKTGDLIRPGQKLAILERSGYAVNELQAILYVSPMNGKKIDNGMSVQISPSSVNQEEYGNMLGLVTAVSHFPSTRDGMMKVLNNEALVAKFSKKNDPMTVTSILLPSSSTESGYQWSSPKGPPIQISSGTMCKATITINEQPPILFVIPTLKKYFSGREN